MRALLVQFQHGAACNALHPVEARTARWLLHIHDRIDRDALPLTQETQGILNAKLFARMRRGGYLIQVGRGEHLVDEDLLAALESGQLDGAALDVFAAEPLAPGHPFWHHPKIVVTPHDACEVRVEAVADMLVAAADAIRAGQRPPHAIDRQRGY